MFGKARCSEMSQQFSRILMEAEGFLDLGLAEDAVRCLEELPPEEMTALEVLRLRCRALEVAGSHENMVAVAEILVGSRPDVPEHWESLMRAKRLAGQAKDGACAGIEAVAQHPDQACLWLELARCQIEDKDTEGARHAVGTAIDLDSTVRLQVLDDPDFAGIFSGSW